MNEDIRLAFIIDDLGTHFPKGFYYTNYFIWN
jgi:hypothetical protein